MKVKCFDTSVVSALRALAAQIIDGFLLLYFPCFVNTMFVLHGREQYLRVPASLMQTWYSHFIKLAGRVGIEPTLSGLEPDMLP